MRFLGRDLDEKVTTTYGRQLAFAGMLFCLVGVNLDHEFPQHPLVGVLIVAAGTLLIGLSLFHRFKSRAEEIKTPKGTKS